MTHSQKAKRNNKIYAKWLNKEATKTDLAEEFNLSYMQISRIITEMKKEQHVF